MNAYNTVFDAKRLIGRKFNETAVQEDMKHFSFKVIPKDGDRPYIKVRKAIFSDNGEEGARDFYTGFCWL